MSSSPIEPGSAEGGAPLHRLPSAEAVPGEDHQGEGEALPSAGQEYSSVTGPVHFVSSPSNYQSQALPSTSYPSHPYPHSYGDPSAVDPYAQFGPPSLHNPLSPPPHHQGVVGERSWTNRGGPNSEDVGEADDGASLPSVSASLPLPLLVSSVMASSPPSPPLSSLDSSYASHRPVPILTSNLTRGAPAVVPSSHLDTLEALASSDLPSLPPIPSSPQHQPSVEPTVEADYPSIPSNLPRLPTYAVSMGHEEEEEEEVVPGAGGDGDDNGDGTPPPVINIHYAEDAEEEVAHNGLTIQTSGPIGGLATQSVASYDYGGEEEKKHEGGGYDLGVTAASAITATTIPYQMSNGTFNPGHADDGLNNTSRFTTYGGSSHYPLDGEGLGAIGSSIGSTTTPSPLPYNTASSLVLLSPPGGDATVSPSAHSTPLHLRPSSALSVYSPAPEDVNGTMKSAISVLSYGEGDEEEGEVVDVMEGRVVGMEEGYPSYQNTTASYQYSDVDDTKEGMRGDMEGAMRVAGMAEAMHVVAEEKEREDEGLQVVRVDGMDGLKLPEGGISDIELATLQRGTSSVADEWQHSGVQSVKVEDPVSGAIASLQNMFKISVTVNNNSGINQNAEGQSGAVAAAGRGRSPQPKRKFRWPLFSALVLVVDVLLFIIPLAWSSWTFASLYDNPMYGPDGSTLLHFGAKFTPALLIHSENWRLLVSCFLHAGIIHIVFSLVIGLMFSWSLEQEYGWYRVLPIWLISGVFSQLFSALLSPQFVSVGGTAALAGVVGSFMADFCHTHERIVGKWNYFFRNCFTSGVMFVAGIFPFVDNWGIGAGAVMGFFLGLVLYAPVNKTREGKWKVHHPFLAVPAAFMVVAMFAVITGVLYSQSSLSASTYSERGNAHYIGCVDTSYWTCHSGVPFDCFNPNDGSFAPGSGVSGMGSGNGTDVQASGYC